MSHLSSDVRSRADNAAVCSARAIRVWMTVLIMLFLTIPDLLVSTLLLLDSPPPSSAWCPAGAVCRRRVQRGQTLSDSVRLCPTLSDSVRLCQTGQRPGCVWDQPTQYTGTRSPLIRFLHALQTDPVQTELCCVIWTNVNKDIIPGENNELSVTTWSQLLENSRCTEGLRINSFLFKPCLIRSFNLYWSEENRRFPFGVAPLIQSLHKCQDNIGVHH